MNGWGPIHSCQAGCGQEVQYLSYKLFDAGTLLRHRCRNVSPQPPIEWRECLCGQPIEIIGEVRYEAKSTRLHTCALRPPPPAKVTPIKRDKPVEPPDVSRIPRGAIVL